MTPNLCNDLGRPGINRRGAGRVTGFGVTAVDGIGGRGGGGSNHSGIELYRRRGQVGTLHDKRLAKFPAGRCDDEGNHARVVYIVA